MADTNKSMEARIAQYHAGRKRRKNKLFEWYKTLPNPEKEALKANPKFRYGEKDKRGKEKPFFPEAVQYTMYEYMLKDKERKRAREEEKRAKKEKKRQEYSDRVDKAGFGEEAYFNAQQVWRALNAPRGTKYLLYKNHLAREKPGFAELSEGEKKVAVEEMMKDRPFLSEEYYKKIPSVRKALGWNDELPGEPHPDDWYNMRPRDVDSYVGLLLGDETAPVLEDKYRGQLGFPQDYGTEEYRHRAYEDWLRKQENARPQGNEGAFNRYMNSLNPQAYG